MIRERSAINSLIMSRYVSPYVRPGHYPQIQGSRGRPQAYSPPLRALAPNTSDFDLSSPTSLPDSAPPQSQSQLEAHLSSTISLGTFLLSLFLPSHTFLLTISLRNTPWLNHANLQLPLAQWCQFHQPLQLLPRRPLEEEPPPPPPPTPSSLPNWPRGSTPRSLWMRSTPLFPPPVAPTTTDLELRSAWSNHPLSARAIGSTPFPSLPRPSTTPARHRSARPRPTLSQLRLVH